MKRSILNLGRTPLKRRLVAAMLLVGTAIVTSVLRSEGNQRWFDLITNVVIALVALGLLHLRWRSRERKIVTPEKARDIFS